MTERSDPSSGLRPPSPQGRRQGNSALCGERCRDASGRVRDHFGCRAAVSQRGAHCGARRSVPDQCESEAPPSLYDLAVTDRRPTGSGEFTSPGLRPPPRNRHRAGTHEGRPYGWPCRGAMFSFAAPQRARRGGRAAGLESEPRATISFAARPALPRFVIGGCEEEDEWN
jgi:hypothetical protein